MNQNIRPDFKITGPIRLPLAINDQVDYHQLYYFEYHQERWAAVIYGDITQDCHVPLRIESACFFGHVFNSRQCDCGYQLTEAFARIREKKFGLVIYGIDQDARGLGIESHFRIYDLRQNQNLDTEAVFKELHAKLDNRSYDAVNEILRFLGLQKIHLLSNNVKRIEFLKNNGFDVIREELEAPLDTFNMATMMLEKEDLGYEWSFYTHAHWLSPMQSRVEGNSHRYAGNIVANNKNIIAEWIGDEWDVALHLKSILDTQKLNIQHTHIAYLTDFPRLDEIALYAKLGISCLVLPFTEFPLALQQEAKKFGIKLQDWARENRYSTPRPQWELKETTDNAHIYQRNNEQFIHDL